MPGKDNKAYKGWRGTIKAALDHHPEKFSKEACKKKGTGKLCPYAIFTKKKEEGDTPHYKEQPHTTSGTPKKKKEFKGKKGFFDEYSFVNWLENNHKDFNEAIYDPRTWGPGIKKGLQTLGTAATIGTATLGGIGGNQLQAAEKPAMVQTAKMSKPDLSQATDVKDYYDGMLGDVKAHYLPDGKIIHVDMKKDYWQKKTGSFGTVYSKWQDGKWSQWVKSPKTLK